MVFQNSTKEYSGILGKKNLIKPFSPIGLALISYTFFILSTLIPPNIYESVVNEPDRMFLNPDIHILVAGSILAFCIGVIWYDSLPRRKIDGHTQCYLERWVILLPVLIAAGINAISFIILLSNNPWFLTGWLDDSVYVRYELDLTGSFSYALSVLFTVGYWSIWRLLERESNIRHNDWILRVSILLAVVFAITTALMEVSRFDILPGIFAIIMVLILKRFYGLSMTKRDFACVIVIFSIILVLLFTVFSWLRGYDSLSLVVETFAGYTVASYNRLAAVLAGDLILPYASVYAFRMLVTLPILNRWWDIGTTIDIPSAVDVWLSEFSAASAAGLRGEYIWTSAFGYVYADIGWAILAYFLIIGMIASMAWDSLKQGKSIGIVFYPWMAYCILFWFGYNCIAYPKSIVFLVTGFLLTVYEHLIQILAYNTSCRLNSKNAASTNI